MVQLPAVSESVISEKAMSSQQGAINLLTPLGSEPTKTASTFFKDIHQVCFCVCPSPLRRLASYFEGRLDAVNSDVPAKKRATNHGSSANDVEDS